MSATRTASTPSASVVSLSQPVGSGLPQPGWETLPPYEEVFDGVRVLTASYFQLGFLPKALFFEQLRTDRDSIDVFLLSGILSVSARFTPSLVRRYGGGTNATQIFLQQASCLVQDRMFRPTLESIQGFFLISIAEWGNGDKNRSLVYMGIAVRLAGILRMHREETYRLPNDASNRDIVHSEAARRTFWMLETFENLHSGSDSPIAFSYKDITVLLPCDEREFTFGLRPSTRAALPGTPPAIGNPSLTRLQGRSLFATLLQTHNLWGQVAKLISAVTGPDQLSAGSDTRLDVEDYDKLSMALLQFEKEVPPQHSWSVWNLQGFKIEGLDLAYLSAVMVLRLSNIILRRSYLHDTLYAHRSREMTGNNNVGHLQNENDMPESSSAVAEQLFDNMLILHEQITAFFEHRSPEQGYPALIVFCVYVCGSLANHLRQQSQLCPRVAPQAAGILHKSTQGLSDLQSAWPLAKSWYLALCSASKRLSPEGHAVTTPAPTLERRLDETAAGGEVSISGQEAHEGDFPSAMDVQFNGPLLSDTMFEAFESYLWNDAYINVDRGAYPELFP